MIHEFELLYSPFGGESPHFDDPVYDRLKAGTPPGCVVTRRKDVLWLSCRRPGDTRLTAIADTVVEVHALTGLLMTDMGFVKLWEWFGPDERKAELVAQLLMMACERATAVGISVEDLTGFVRAVGQVQGS